MKTYFLVIPPSTTVPIVLHRKKVGRFLFVVETAELLNIFLIILMALFLNAQGRGTNSLPPDE